MALLVASAAASLMLATPAAADGPVAVTFDDECGKVRITYSDADAAESYTVTRDGATVMSATTLAGGPFNFAVFAGSGQEIELTGALTGSHIHVTPPEGCSEPQVTVSIEDRCQGTSAITFHNAGTGPAPGVFGVNTGTVAILPTLPAGDFEYLVESLSEYQKYKIVWAQSTTASAGVVLEHIYATPGDCGKQLDVSYVDKCDSIEWTVTNEADGAQKVELLKNGAVVETKWVPVGDSTFTTPAAEGDVFSMRLFGDTATVGDRHVYHVPDNCDLPTTGTRIQLFVWVGVGLVLLGAGAFVLTRRRQIVLPPDAG